jgi:hypothetical protein
MAEIPMAISLLLKSATGALFLNDSGISNDQHACALQGFLSFPQGEEGGVSQLRLESTARLDGIQGALLRYKLASGRGLRGLMFLVPRKTTVTDPDYTGFVGDSDELIVTGWNRSVNNRPYVLLNVRENPEWAAKRQASNI